MNRATLITYLFSLFLWSCSTPQQEIVYESSIEEGIFFNREGIPSFAEKIEGLYPAESFGAWTNHEYYSGLKIFFKEPLPKEFDLHIISCGYRDNGTAPISVHIGEGIFTYTESPCWEINEKVIPISLNKEEHIIEIIAPNPQSPAQAEGGTEDIRILGLALSRIYVLPKQPASN